MTDQDREPIITIAMMAALADGQATAEEKTRLQSAVAGLGAVDLDAIASRIGAGQVTLAGVAAKLSGDDARRAAYEAAVAVCHSDGAANPKEAKFLGDLRQALGLSGASVADIDRGAATIAASAPTGSGSGSASSGAPATAALDEMILQQAILTGACEILPDRLASLAILPLQLRMVYRIGQAHGQQLDANQVKDLAGALGIGAAAQAMQSVVRKIFGTVSGGLLGGLIGGAAGVASGAAVTFAATYALGHVAQRYYAQGRQLSPDDLRSLFAKFQEDAKTIWPKVQEQVQTQARTLDVQRLLSGGR
ncbi:MAG TPA: DUF533 domain-containing protein [Gemmatimonadaceae bacterium]|nr:DUF533 domain-containing protein [Gemmatimonadaceae bacterium]